VGFINQKARKLILRRLGYHPEGTQFILLVKKGKAIPVQAWTGPEGSRSLRLSDFMTIGT